MSSAPVLPALYPARISVSSSLLAATMNQKSSLREDPQFVSWVLTGNKGDYDLFLPIVSLSVGEVWDAIFWLDAPTSLNPNVLERLYRGASGECPIIKSPQAPPCASGRFGCWTCTVVRKDKSARELIRSGHSELKPFLAFRNWLSEFRNDPSNRWATKRSGQKGLGPFTISARKKILVKVDELEDKTR